MSQSNDLSLTKLFDYSSASDQATFQWNISIPITILILLLYGIYISSSKPREGKFSFMLPGMLIYVSYLSLLILGREFISDNPGSIFNLWFIHGLFILFLFLYAYREKLFCKFCKPGNTGKYLFEIPHWNHDIYFISMDGDMTKIFHEYLIKRSFLISLLIFILFITLDLVFSLMSELENLSEEYDFFDIFLYVLSVSPSNAINFLEGACLLGVMISLGISHQEGNLNVLRSSGESPLKIVLISSLGPIFLIFLFLLSNELFLKDLRTDAEINKNLNVQSTEKNIQNNNWIKDGDSFLTYSYMKDSFIYRVKFIKTDDDKVLYLKWRIRLK